MSKFYSCLMFVFFNMCQGCSNVYYSNSDFISICDDKKQCSHSSLYVDETFNVNDFINPKLRKDSLFSENDLYKDLESVYLRTSSKSSVDIVEIKDALLKIKNELSAISYLLNEISGQKSVKPKVFSQKTSFYLWEIAVLQSYQMEQARQNNKLIRQHTKNLVSEKDFKRLQTRIHLENTKTEKAIQIISDELMLDSEFLNKFANYFKKFLYEKNN